jgi:hypothetical protein
MEGFRSPKKQRPPEGGRSGYADRTEPRYFFFAAFFTVFLAATFFAGFLAGFFAAIVFPPRNVHSLSMDKLKWTT